MIGSESPKKAQMKTFESVAVLIVFFVLIGLGLVFYSGVHKTSLKKTYAERTEMEAVKIAMKVSYMPEILCSRRRIIEDDCFDVYKLEAVSSTVSDDDWLFLFYQRDFRDSVITIKEVFPDAGKTFVLYSNNPVDAVPEDRKDAESRKYHIIPTFVPVSLKNSTRDKEYSMGMLNVTMFIPKV